MMVRTCRPATCCRTSNSFSIIASTKFISYIFCCKVMFFNMKSGCSWCVKIISIRRIISIKTNRNYRSSLINRKFFSFITVRIHCIVCNLKVQDKVTIFCKGYITGMCISIMRPSTLYNTCLIINLPVHTSLIKVTLCYCNMCHSGCLIIFFIHNVC